MATILPNGSFIALLGLALFLVRPDIGHAGPIRSKPADFDSEIRPLLQAHCVRCHGETKPKASLDLRTGASLAKGGISGPVVVAGKSGRSLLFEMIHSGEMPPKKEKKRLSAEQIALIKSWIDGGALGMEALKDPGLKVTDANRSHWAFRPLAKPQAANIDAFLLKKLEAKGLHFSAPADKHTLVRRVYFDLHGLPPSLEEIDAALNDKSPDWYEKLLDRLLASPHFGERWGRQWLDNAGYSDVIGMDNDATIISTIENKWLYRDWVVKAINEDTPWDRFLTLQLAGDELVDWRNAKEFTPAIRDALIPTGFLRNAADDTGSIELNTPDIQHGMLQRTVETVVNNVLALSFNCAKCHDHKYEPIPQRDYYQVLALFQPVYDPNRWLQPNKRQLPDLAPPLHAQAKAINDDLDGLIAQAKKLHDKLQKAGPKTPEEKQRVATLAKVMNDLGSQKKSWQHWQVVYDAGPPTPTKILRRGDYTKLGDEVSPGLLSVLCPPGQSTKLPAVKPAGATSGRRLALAKQITEMSTIVGALAMRVRVNRIWQQLFGKGIVESADNLGVTGTPPSHPELLDWLAQDFIAAGQRLKPFLKRIMTSNAYRQSTAGTGSEFAERGQKADPDNQLLWRQRLRRLESEMVRDAMLAVSGKLDRAVAGPFVPVEARGDGRFEPNAKEPKRFRRSLYLLQRRHYHPTFLEAFDQPAMGTNCTRRPSSAVVGSALVLLNDPFTVEQVSFFKERVLQMAGKENAEKQADLAFRLAVGRSMRPDEQAKVHAFFKETQARYQAEKMTAAQAREQTLASFCHVLFNTNEFLYVR